jgi:AMIN domain
MIRINLLEVRPRSAERLDSILSSGRSSTFISRREAVLGALFLVFTLVILGVLVSRFSPDGEESAKADAVEETAPPVESAAEPAVAVLPSAPPTEAAEAAAKPREEPPPAEAPIAASKPEPPARPAPEAAPARVEPPASSGRTLTAVRATPLADRVDVFLEMENPPSIKGFRVEKPARLVFDIPGTLLLAPDSQRSQEIASPLVSRLRIAQNTFDPPLVRLVLEVRENAIRSDVSTSAAGVSIHVTSAP